MPDFLSNAPDLPRKARLAADYIAILRIVECLVWTQFLSSEGQILLERRSRFEEDIYCDSPLDITIIHSVQVHKEYVFCWRWCWCCVLLGVLCVEIYSTWWGWAETLLVCKNNLCNKVWLPLYTFSVTKTLFVIHVIFWTCFSLSLSSLSLLLSPLPPSLPLAILWM